MNITDVMLFYIIPALLTSFSILWICSLIKDYEYAIVIPWINLILFIILGFNAGFKFSNSKNELIILFIWCIVCSIASVCSAIIILLWLANRATVKITFQSFKKYLDMYFMTALIPIGTVLLCWLNVCIWSCYPKTVLLFVILEVINVSLFVATDWNLRNKAEQRMGGRYIRIGVLVMWYIILNNINYLAFHWFLAYGILYFIRNVGLVVKRHRNDSDPPKNHQNKNTILIQLLRYLPIVAGVISSILLIIIDISE